MDDSTSSEPREPRRPGPTLSIGCAGCAAAGSTACTDCVVTHLLANDDGPIELLPWHPSIPPGGRERAAVASADERALALAVDRLVQAGLVTEAVFVEPPAPAEEAIRR